MPSKNTLTSGRIESRLGRHGDTWRGGLKSTRLLALAAVFGWPLPACTKYSIDWSTVDGGGGTSTNGQFSLRSSIGQPDAGGQMTGGNFALTGGYWAIYAVQTVGAPRLNIANTSTKAVIVSWPSPSTGWTLQQNTNSVSSVNWSNVTSGIQDNGTLRYITAGPMSGNRFYRLTKP